MQPAGMRGTSHLAKLASAALVLPIARLLVAITFLCLARLKHVVHGYSTPKPFGIDDFGRCIEYDRKIVQGWASRLEALCQGGFSGRSVLELGPGSDIGTGLFMHAQGATAYCAIDKFPLDRATPDAFYRHAALRAATHGAPDADRLYEHAINARAGRPSPLGYIVSDNFDLTCAFPERRFDVCVSNATFEQFQDLDLIARQLFAICRPRAVLIAGIDLRTHSRWIREIDPNSIYCVPDWLYRVLSFDSSPRRFRSKDYVAAFHGAGWRSVRVHVDEELATEDKRSSPRGLTKRYRASGDEMRILAFTLTAVRPGLHPD